MLRRVVLLVVHTHHDSNVFVLPWSGDDHLFGARGEVAFRLFAISKEAGRLDDDIDPECFPRKSLRAFLHGETLNLMTINHEKVILVELGVRLLAVDFLRRTALSGVVLHEGGEVVSGDEVVDGDDVDFFAEEALIADCAEDEAADAAESIDADFNHERLSMLRITGSMTEKARK